ncbi:MAG: DinB family protein [Candidatus Heimdallarchaeota archaeon]
MSPKEKHAIWISSGLLSQFASTWKMLEKAIEKVPDEYWYGTDKGWSYSKTVHHIIETQEFYLRDDPEGMIWGKLLKDDKKSTTSDEEKYPIKEILIDYQKTMESKITDYLKAISYEKLLEKDGFKWFSSVFEKLLYLLRHNAHHLGELGRMLREWDCERMRWQ